MTIKISAIGDHICSGKLRRRPKGFTLIEMMVVLVILVLLVASLPIAFNRLLPGYRFRATTEQLMTELRSARSRAQMFGQIIVVGCRESAYAIQSASTKSQKAVSVPTNATLKCSALPDGRTVDHLALYPDGSATGGHITITDGKRSAVVELSALTGRARLIG